VLAALSPVTSWTLDPLQLATPLTLAALYAGRVRRLRRRGTAVPRWRTLLFGAGIVLLVAAVASPVAAVAEQRLFSAHMLQHLVLGDLAPLALLGGLTGPIVRPLLALPAVIRLRALAHPLVALPLWAVNLYAWHLPFLYEGALRHSSVHALEHLAFFAAGALMWMPVLETLPAPAWFGSAAKMGYVGAVRGVETVLANVFLWAGGPFYRLYERSGDFWGISPGNDQVLAGSIMLIEGSLVTMAALAWLFLRLAAEGELRQELIERGLDRRAVERAVRYGRGRELDDRWQEVSPPR
jgi:putative membrane protein